MKIAKFLFFSFIFLTFALMPGLLNAKEKIPVYYFFGDGCSHCAKTTPVLEKLSEKYPEIIIYGKEIYKDKSNALELLDFYKKFEVPSHEQGIPILFLPDKYLMGSEQIPNETEREFKRIIKTHSEITPVPERSDEKSAPSATLSIFAITAAALADSINPCAIAVLIILLTALMMANNKRRAILGALAFISSIYISYFLFGLGLTKVIQSVGLDPRIIYKIVGVVAVLIGLANLKDFFCYGGGGFVMEIPRRWRPTLQALLKKITSPLGAFLIGFVVTLFELPCTGGPYFFVLGLLSQHTSYSVIVPYLLYYNVFFVLPLLVLAFLIYFGHSTLEHAREWKDKNVRLIHLATGLIMLGLGIWVFFY